MQWEVTFCPPYYILLAHQNFRPSYGPVTYMYILWYLSAHCCTQYICQIIHSNPALHCFSIVIYDQAIDGPMGLELLLGFIWVSRISFEILTFFKDEEYVCSKSLRTLSLLLKAILKVHTSTYIRNHHKALKFLTTQYVT